MLDIDPRRGQLTNAVTPGIGTGSGALLSALLVTYLPAPTELVYYVLGAVFLVQALGVALMRETVRRVPGALASLKPEIKLPRTVRAPRPRGRARPVRQRGRWPDCTARSARRCVGKLAGPATPCSAA